MALTSNETTNAAEYTVALKPTSSIKLKKALLWFLYIGAPLVLLVVLCLVMKGYEGYAIGGFLIVMVPLYFCNLLPKTIIPFTKIYSEVSYEYVLKQGQFFINKIYGSDASQFKKRKPLFEEYTISKAESIEPYSESVKLRVQNNEFEIVYNALADEECPDNYAVIFRNDEGKKCIVLFQNNKKMLKAMSFLNSANTITTQLSQ